MAGYGIRAYLIAQSLNQISKAYGESNAILDNCHVRIAFSSNDERTAKRISDALGTATELRMQRNYAGHRLAPWLSHIMVSRQESARPLLTPGEVMQLPAADELVLVSGLPPIRARKLRYYEDRNFLGRVKPSPALSETAYRDRPSARPDDWTGQIRDTDLRHEEMPSDPRWADEDEGGLQRNRHPDVAEAEVVRPMAAEHEADLGLDESTVDDTSLDRARSSRATRAYGVNQGEGRHYHGDDLLPSF
jgi:type IV secretion system protein VirD4